MQVKCHCTNSPALKVGFYGSIYYIDIANSQLGTPNIGIGSMFGLLEDVFCYLLLLAHTLCSGPAGSQHCSRVLESGPRLCDSGTGF